MNNNTTKVLEPTSDMILKIKGKNVEIKKEDYYLLNNDNTKKILKNTKLNDLANLFNIEIIDFELINANLISPNLFEYVFKAIVEVEGKKYIALGESNEKNLNNFIANSYRATMAQIRAENRAIIKALKSLGLEGSFYSESEFEIEINKNTKKEDDIQKNKNLEKSSHSKTSENNITSNISEKINNEIKNKEIDTNNPGEYEVQIGKCKGLKIKEIKEKNVWMFNYYINCYEGKGNNKNPLILEAGQFAKMYLEQL